MNYRNTQLITTLILVLSLIFNSCSDVFIQQTDKDLLTNGSWIVKSVITEPLNPKETIEEVDFEQNCPYDELLNLNLDGIFYITKNFKLCDGSNPAIQTGTWQITEKEGGKVVDFITKQSTTTYSLQSVTTNTLVLKQEWLKERRTQITTYQNTNSK